MKTENERRVLGALMIVGAMTLLPMGDGIGKSLMDSLPPLQVVCGRFVAHFLWVAPFVIFYYRRRLLSEFNSRAQVFRAVLLFASALLFFLSIAEIPLARAIALFASAPFVVAALSFALLGERVRVAGVLCIVGGFGGVLCIARPDADWQWHNILAISAGVVYALFLLISRKYAGAAPPMVGSFYVGAVGGAILLFLMLFVDTVPPDNGQIASFALMGGLTALAHYFLARAFDFARAVFLSLFTYWEIAAGVIIGFLLHGDIPDIRDWIGIAVITAFGMALIVREDRESKK